MTVVSSHLSPEPSTVPLPIFSVAVEHPHLTDSALSEAAVAGSVSARSELVGSCGAVGQRTSPCQTFIEPDTPRGVAELGGESHIRGGAVTLESCNGEASMLPSAFSGPPRRKSLFDAVELEWSKEKLTATLVDLLSKGLKKSQANRHCSTRGDGSGQLYSSGDALLLSSSALSSTNSSRTGFPSSSSAHSSVAGQESINYPILSSTTDLPADCAHEDIRVESDNISSDGNKLCLEDELTGRNSLWNCSTISGSEESDGALSMNFQNAEEDIARLTTSRLFKFDESAPEFVPLSRYEIAHNQYYSATFGGLPQKKSFFSRFGFSSRGAFSPQRPTLKGRSEVNSDMFLRNKTVHVSSTCGTTRSSECQSFVFDSDGQNVLCGLKHKSNLPTYPFRSTRCESTTTTTSKVGFFAADPGKCSYSNSATTEAVKNVVPSGSRCFPPPAPRSVQNTPPRRNDGYLEETTPVSAKPAAHRPTILSFPVSCITNRKAVYSNALPIFRSLARFESSGIPSPPSTPPPSSVQRRPDDQRETEFEALSRVVPNLAIRRNCQPVSLDVELQRKITAAELKRLIGVPTFHKHL